MITLAIENSGSFGSVALLDGETLIREWPFESPRGRGTSLFATLEDTLSLGIAPQHILVGTGPGSYNGIRSAIAAAWGIATAQNATLSGISSLLGHESEEYLAIGDARSGHFYFAWVKDGRFVEEPGLTSLSELEEKMARVVNCPVFSPSEIPAVSRVTIRHPSASILARHGPGVSVGSIPEPLYLKPPHITVPRSVNCT